MIFIENTLFLILSEDILVPDDSVLSNLDNLPARIDTRNEEFLLEFAVQKRFDFA